MCYYAIGFRQLRPNTGCNGFAFQLYHKGIGSSFTIKMRYSCRGHIRVSYCSYYHSQPVFKPIITFILYALCPFAHSFTALLLRFRAKSTGYTG